MRFLPATRKEMLERGWDQLDIILVTGDAYIDSPYSGVAVIGRVLESKGYRVGIIGQPDISSKEDIRRLGEPALFWGITGGCIDSMVANRTATGRRRKRDDYTPGGENNRRPDRAVIAYANLIRQHFKQTRPIVLGGIEASLRRLSHYDFWSDRIRRSILFDARADYLLYGMAERSIADLAHSLKSGGTPEEVKGLCYVSYDVPEGCRLLPSFKETASDKDAFTAMFHTFYRNNDPISAKPLAQLQDTRYLVQNPPAQFLTMTEMDTVYNLPYMRDAHPLDLQSGPVKALETIRFSISTHRGCYGECNFCAIAVHEGQTVRWRSEQSILKEARQIAAHPKFKGTIHDVGGPTANMYGFECDKKLTKGNCPKKCCVFPDMCSQMPVDHDPQLSVLAKIRKIKGVKKVVVASGIRYDMILNDGKHGEQYLRQLIRHHVSGQMKIAPEHSEDSVLEKMRKPGKADLVKFREMFYRITRQEQKDQYLTYYMIAAHPGCTDRDMKQLKQFASTELKLLPEQVQVFTPTPSTYSSVMYWTEKDPFTGQPCFVEKSFKGKERQKSIVMKSGKHQTGRHRRSSPKHESGPH